MQASCFVCAVKESQKNMSEIIFFFSQWSALIFEVSEMTGIR